MALPLLYLAGPMTGLPEFNYPAFESARSVLEAAGYGVLCPTDNKPEADRVESWTWYLRRSIAQLVKADALAVLPDPGRSEGLALEVSLARSLNMPVHPLDYWIPQYQFTTERNES